MIKHLLRRISPFRITVQRFSCCYQGCLDKFSEPIATRYTGCSDTCVYWEVFKKSDGLSGYNDWKVVDVVPKPKKYVEEDALARNEGTAWGMGRVMATQVKVGGYGAYICDDERYDYYIVKWLSEPWVAKKSEVIALGNEDFVVQKGE